MDQNNQPTTNPEVTVPPQQPVMPQPQPVMPVPSQQQQSGNRKMLKLLLVIFLLVILALGGFIAYSYFNAQKTYNAGVYNYPTAVPASPTPTGGINPSDTTDSAIDSDNKVIDQELNNLNTDINGVDQSLNDKQTNLQ